MATEVSVIGKDRALAEALERGYTLPAEWYTSPAVLELENKRIFHRFWQYVGYTEQVARPGDVFTGRVGDASIVVARDQDETLRAYVETSRHPSGPDGADGPPQGQAAAGTGPPALMPDA